MYRRLYLTEEENEFVKDHDEGYVRILVKEAMTPLVPDKGTPLKETEEEDI